jgi:GntR family transcriptional regulator/MocR family aminotransferase
MLPALASLFVELDRRAPTHLQEQICRALRGAIAAGVLAPGTRLPSSRALADELGVSRTTTVAAELQLVAEGYLVARARSGTFVAADPPDPPAAAAPAPVRAPARPTALRLSRRADAEARAAMALGGPRQRARAFGLSRPALDAFPVREWGRVVVRRAQRLTAAQLDYSHESPELRAAIAELVSASRGLRVHADQVMLWSGAQAALEFAFTALVDPGERARMEDPGYPGARNALVSAGAAVALAPIDREGMTVPRGTARLAYVTPSCQFPLGVTMSLARRRALLAWAERSDACIVEDDYDCEFRHAGAPVAALHALDQAGRVIYVNSFSRTMFPSLRLGYLIAPAALVDRLRAARTTREEHLPSLAQLALADFIAEGHFVRHLRRMRVAYRARRQALVDAARATGVLRVRPIEAGLHAVVDIDADAGAVAAVAARRGIIVAPLASFYAAGAAPAQALVLGFGAVPPDKTRAAVAELAAAVAEVSARP